MFTYIHILCKYKPENSNIRIRMYARIRTYILCKNKPEISWVNKVHERLVGYEYVAQLPAEPILALQHHKSIEKQEKQN